MALFIGLVEKKLYSIQLVLYHTVFHTVSHTLCAQCPTQFAHSVPHSLRTVSHTMSHTVCAQCPTQFAQSAHSVPRSVPHSLRTVSHTVSHTVCAQYPASTVPHNLRAQPALPDCSEMALSPNTARPQSSSLLLATQAWKTVPQA